MTRHELVLDYPFAFEAGGVLENLKIVYHTSKDSYSPSDKVVVICHALTANSDPEEWWDTMVGPGRLFDTERYFILCVNMLGSPYGSSGPVSDPRFAEGEEFRPFEFPPVTVRDMVEASIAVRHHLGIEKVDLLVGSSIGGFQAVEWSIREPEIIRKAIFIATSPRVTPWISAGMESQRMALEADCTFREQKDSRGGANGLKCARAQAMITYRSYEGYCMTQPETDQDTLFSERVASYQRYQGAKLAGRFDAYSYWYLTKSVDSHNVGRGRGGVAQALSRIKAATTVVSIDSDGLFPPKEMKEWSAYVPGARLVSITSDFGHDGFLLETEQLTDIIKSLL